MKTVNSLSGGKTSSYIAVNYPADYNVFALVRTDDKKCMYPDAKVRQMVGDKIGTEFIGTLEMDEIINTMFDLEQLIGKEINWVSGETFDQIIKQKKDYLPNIMVRFCTTEMKLKPIFEWWHKNINEPFKMRIGFRANEQNRAKKMMEKTNKNGLSEIKATVSKNKNGTNNWQIFEWQKPEFPLITDRIYKDEIENFWKDKNVRFAKMNNCVGCFHRNEILLKKMFEIQPNKMNWFLSKEIETQNTFKNGITYEKIKNHKLQLELSFDDFSECDSGYCGL